MTGWTGADRDFQYGARCADGRIVRLHDITFPATVAVSWSVAIMPV